MDDMISHTVGPSIETKRADDLWITLVGKSPLEKALFNLCTNVKDAMPFRGRIVNATVNRWFDEKSAKERGVPTDSRPAALEGITGHRG